MLIQILVRHRELVWVWLIFDVLRVGSDIILLRCDTMSRSQEPLVLFGRDDECAGCCHHFQRLTIV